MVSLCRKSMPKLMQRLLAAPPKRVVLSGPSGFLGSRVLDVILEVHNHRINTGVDPGEVILLSSSPGHLMGRLSLKHADRMKTIRASRVDYYTQHSPTTWRDQLGALGVHGDDCVFVNLAAVASPLGRKNAMHSVNYAAAVAAAQACVELGVSHFIQSSTQATNSERAGQVPYSRGKAMADFHLAQIREMPVTIACCGLLYCKHSRAVGQDAGAQKLNLIDLSVLPLTPIMGSGRAPLQPQEVSDAALRFACLALFDPSERPQQEVCSSQRLQTLQASPTSRPTQPHLRIYDAVGPQTMSMVDMLRRFAHFQGNHSFRPVYIDYRNMENILNVMSLGNLNRQFVSLLRSEQDDLKAEPFIGDHTAWDRLLGPDNGVRLTTLDNAFAPARARRFPLGSFPFATLLKLVWRHPKVLMPGARLTLEILANALAQGALYRRSTLSVAEQEELFLRKFGHDADVSAAAVREVRHEFERFDQDPKGELSEHEAMQLLESKRTSRSPASFQELRAAFDAADTDGDGRLSFLEWACLSFRKHLEEWEPGKRAACSCTKVPRK